MIDEAASSIVSLRSTTDRIEDHTRVLPCLKSDSVSVHLKLTIIINA